MPITNIVDKRTNKYNVDVMAIFEDSWHNDSSENTLQFNITNNGIEYIGIRKTTITRAIKYAEQHISSDVTLFIYDVGVENYVDYDYIDENNKLVIIK